MSEDESVPPAWYIVLDILSNSITDGPIWQRALFSIALSWMIVQVAKGVISLA